MGKRRRRRGEKMEREKNGIRGGKQVEMGGGGERGNKHH